METDGNQTETPGKEKPEPRKRVAHCKNCTYEWNASNGNEKKPSRCPLCKSRSVVWRDECSKEELSRNNRQVNPAPSGQQTEEHEVPPENHRELPKVNLEQPEKTEQVPKKEGFSREDAEKAISPIPMQSIILLLGVGLVIAAVFFLRRKGKAARREPETKAPQQTSPPSGYITLPGLGGGLA